MRVFDPYRVQDGIGLFKEARAWTKAPEGGIAVVVARKPCALREPPAVKIPVEVEPGLCDGCDYCLKFCECPALVKDVAGGKVTIDHTRCVDCGQCIEMCLSDAILPVKGAMATP